MRVLKFIICTLLILNLPACANRSVVDENLATKLASISINFHEESISSYEFQNHLRNILDTSPQNIKYRLEIQIDRSHDPLIIQKDSEVLRANVQFSLSYKLYKLDDNSMIYSGKLRQIGSYNTLFSPFSTNVELETTNINLAKSCAEELRRRLILFFKRAESLVTN